MKTVLSLFILVIFAFNLGGCASGTTLVTGVKRDAISFEQVRFYQVPPANYEVIAAVRASSEIGFTDQQNLDMAVEELKIQAARVGANGIILEKTGKESTGSYGNFFSNGFGGGFFVGGENYSQVITGTAIYVK
ncbi:hypothetical protein HUE58_06500 [Candidatus Ruthia endofausta]|uniref:DUF4156 domain-containing protein n=1 Tax=Candidatus Ruthia endofausta TaxID=2738852 RepID=A0A6N0HR07_9GAMM|nr:hypothetical protein [Candidatus Ruthia endofausta]QKQ24727.1 hypothetical protein HUE58_06500 [Candidatus Ruthia endofausta]